MRRYAVVALLALAATVPASAGERVYDLLVDGRPWLRTITTPYDDSSDAARELSYKVYTHIYDFDGEGFLTKGAGGKYSHHRGLFIGWRNTQVAGKQYDTWHMTDCFQRHVEWLDQKPGHSSSRQIEVVEWCDNGGEPFIREVRTISARRGGEGLRIIDFSSKLSSLKGAIQLRGDLQHAGMQVRLADEVSRHEDSTEYLLPKRAEERDDDEVVGAWWVVCSAVIDGKRYWVAHMTPSNHPLGVPVYSIRRYARFGAFFEADLEPNAPLSITFRIIVSDKEIDADKAKALYAEYSASVRDTE